MLTIGILKLWLLNPKIEETMIIKPEYWKNDLKHEMNTFIEYLETKGTDQDDFDYRLERFLFLTAFIIRKLAESRKLNSNLLGNLQKIYYLNAKNDVEITDDNFVFHSDNYEISPKSILSHKPDRYKNMSIKDIMNIIIHSYTLNTYISLNTLIGIYVTTEKRKSELYYFEFSQLISIISKCISN